MNLSEPQAMFLKLLFLIVFVSSLTSASFLPLKETNYNASLAEKFWHFCMGSYCSPHRISQWDIGFVSALYPQVTDITVVVNSTGNACGFTAYNPAEDEVMIVFRGTQPLSLKNWIDDLDFFKTSYPGCSNCNVHRGFYYTYLEVRDEILANAKSLFAKYPNSRKLVTGHSLGGALAVLASIDIVQLFGPIDEFYTYGQPRVGDKNFADFVNTIVPGNFNSRITHHWDPVPHLPLENMGFYHINTEVYYDADSSSYHICQAGEDPNCSNARADLWLPDHLNYMNKDMSIYQLECQL